LDSSEGVAPHHSIAFHGRKAARALPVRAPLPAGLVASNGLGAFMIESHDPSLSPSERRTLQDVAETELYPSELDWLAVQRLKKLNLVEDRSTGVLALTGEGRRVLKRLLSNH